MPVTTESLITADYFNTLQAKISSVIFDEYGYISAFPSQQVNTGTFITADQWKNLFYDTTKCIIHQTNADIPSYVYTTTNITTTTLITAAFANALETAIDDAYTNRYTVHPSQQIVEVISDARTLVWNNGLYNEGISNSTILEFDDQTNPDLDLLYWLNLGGSITLELTYPDETYTGYDLFWKDLIDTANSTLSSYIFNRTNSSTYVFEIFGPDGIEDIDSDADGRIRIDLVKNENSLEIVTNFLSISPDMNSDTMNINVGVDITLVSSSGNSGPIPYGVPSVIPIIDKTIFDETSREISLLKYLKANPRSLTYTFERGQTSSSQTITLFNRGNDTVTVSDITFTGGNVGVTAIPVYSWGTSPTTTLAPGESKTFTLSYSYSGGFEGDNYSVISIESDGIINPWYIDVKQTIITPIFDFTLTPSLWSYTTSTIDIVGQSFTLVPKLFTNYNSYTASITPTPAGFSVQSRQGSLPRIEFNPYLAAGGTYNPVLSVQATDGITNVTRTANTNIVYDELASQHLGDWISAGAYNNAIIGASYDIIRGVRYLTVGVGIGSEDGTPEILGGGLQYAIVGNLGLNADSKIKNGVSLFKAPSNVSYSDFLNEYGVHLRSAGNVDPINVYIYRTYSFNIETAGTYNWISEINKSGFVQIDGINVSSFNQTSTSDEQAFLFPYTTGEIFLTQGSHFVTLAAIRRPADNVSNTTFAFRLYNSSTEIWNTLVPVRASIPYYYWKEVYRIPITKGAYTYESREYLIKDFSQIAGVTYGSFYQGANIFKVVDDGFNNLEILLQQKSVSVTDNGFESTLQNLQYSFYYYILYFTNNQRVNQLEEPTGNQTRYFVGFTNSGEVRTRLVDYPRFGTPPAQQWNTGGEGGDTEYGSGFNGYLVDDNGKIVFTESGVPVSIGGPPPSATNGYTPGMWDDPDRADPGPSDTPSGPVGTAPAPSSPNFDNGAYGYTEDSSPSSSPDPGGQGGGGVPGAGA